MISLAAEPIAHIGSFTITNTLTDTVLVDFFIITLALYVSKKNSLVPSAFQGSIELIIEAFYGLTQTVSHEYVAKIFPFVMTFFLFIVVSNWTGLLPVLTSLGFFH